MRTAGATSANPICPAVTVPARSPRKAVVIRETGLTFTKASSQPGMVVGSTLMFEANTNGKMKVKPKVITVMGVRTRRPITIKTHPEAYHEQEDESGDNPSDASLGLVAQQEPDAEDDPSGDAVAQDVDLFSSTAGACSTGRYSA